MMDGMHIGRMICTLDHTTVQLIMCESGRYKYKFMVYERCLRERSCGIDEESLLNGMIHTSLNGRWMGILYLSVKEH